jgi:hypothetical protein
MQLWDSMCWPHVNPVPSGAVGKDCQRRLLSRPKVRQSCSVGLLLRSSYFVWNPKGYNHVHKPLPGGPAYSISNSTHTPNILVEWLALLLRIREVPDSNLGLATGYADRGSSWFFLSSSIRMLASYLTLGHDRFLSNLFLFVIIHLPPYHLRYIV